MSGNPPANWYADPEGGPQMRYWDGSAWTQHFTDYPQPTPPPPPPPTAEVADSGVASADQPSPPPVAVGPTPSAPAGPARRQQKTAVYLTVAVAVLALVAVGIVVLNRRTRGDGSGGDGSGGGGGGRSSFSNGLEVSVTAQEARLSDAAQMPPGTHLLVVEVTLRNTLHDTELGYPLLSDTLVDAKGHPYADDFYGSGDVARERINEVDQFVGAPIQAFDGSDNGTKFWAPGGGFLADPLAPSDLRADSTVIIDRVFLVDDSAPKPMRYSLDSNEFGIDPPTFVFTVG